MKNTALITCRMTNEALHEPQEARRKESQRSRQTREEVAERDTSTRNTRQGESLLFLPLLEL